MDEQAALAAWVRDPRLGLILIGERETFITDLADRVAASFPLRRVPAAIDPGRLADLVALPGRTLLCSAAHLLSAESAAVLARAPRVVVWAPTLAMVPPPLRTRLALVLGGPVADLPEAPGADFAELAVAMAAVAGTRSHELECRAASLAGLVTRIEDGSIPGGGGRTPAEVVAAVLWGCVFGPRAAEQQSAPPSAGADDSRPDGMDEAAPEEAAGLPDEAPPQEDAHLPLPLRPAASPRPPRSRRALTGRGGALGPDAMRGFRRRTILWRTSLRIAIEPSLSAAFPWQRARGWTPGACLRWTRGDLRSAMRSRRGGSLLLLVVDASGSMARGAIQRAKAAALGQLNVAYAQRGKVAVVVASGRSARVALWPTGSVSRARACLAVLPTGGGTPLAAGFVEAARVAAGFEAARVRCVVLTDGRANVGLGGAPKADALAALGRLRTRVAFVQIEPLSGPYAAGGVGWLVEGVSAAGT